LEHCGGYAWVVAEGAFGLDFASDHEASATVTPRFDPPEAHAEFRLRGVDLTMGYRKGSQAGIALRRKQPQRAERVAVVRRSVSVLSGNTRQRSLCFDRVWDF
jgi:hypothetical protein